MTIQNALTPTGVLGGEFTPDTVGLGNVDNTSDMANLYLHFNKQP